MTEEEQNLLINLKNNVQRFFVEFENVENEKEGLEKDVLDLKQQIELLQKEKS